MENRTDRISQESRSLQTSDRLARRMGAEFVEELRPRCGNSSTPTKSESLPIRR